MAFQRSLLGVAIALVSSGTAAAAQSEIYDLSVSGLNVGTITLASEMRDGSYVAGSKVQPSALVGAFTAYAYDAQASGRLGTDGTVSPLRFTSNSTSPRATRRTEIEWKDGTPVRVSVEPPRKSQPDPDTISGALDPVSAGFALLRENDADKICDTVVEVFDGSRRSLLALGKPVEAEEALVCPGMYRRLAGEAHTLSNQEEYPFTLTFEPKADGRMRLERIETRTRFGLAVIARRD